MEQAGQQSLVTPFADKIAPFRIARPLTGSRLIEIDTGGPATEGVMEQDCAFAFNVAKTMQQNTSTPSAQWRGVVELFMVNKFDDGRREKYEGIVKKCVGRFIKEIGLE
jgi:hypothetical protein